MRKLSFLAAMVCLVLAGNALAERAVTVTPVTEDLQNISQSIPPTCQMGNLNPAYWAIGDFVWGAEAYKYLFDAPVGSCSCIDGFTVSQVHFYMQFKATDVPISFNCYADFEETLWDDAMGCFVPGPVICVSPLYTVTITNAGMYDIALPMAQGCPCAMFGYKYGISMNFPDPIPTHPDAITDNFPVGCTSWNDYGTGWYDLHTLNFPGELKMFADILCCENPVDTEGTTWGGVKTLFR